jgi:putative transposase
MSHVKVWIHAVWGTKNHQPILTNEIRDQVFNHIRLNAKEKQIHIELLNGVIDHVHCLLALNADTSLSKTIQLIKGESTHWVNTNNMINTKLEGANEYFAVSVSESVLPKVKEYIVNQKEHHKKKSFKEEYDAFIMKYGLVNHG